MPLVLADRVNETTTTTSTGTITLAGAVSGYQSFAVIGNGNTTYYTIVHQTANEWEVGIGTYTSSGTTLARNTVLASSNSGSLVNFSAGTKFVFCDYPAGRAVYLDTATNVTIPGLTLSGGTANGVLYLNGSKVATSGSALVFDGSNLGVGASPGYRLDVTGGTSSFAPSNSVGAIRTQNNSTTSLELHVRAAAGKNGFISFTEDTVADRWVMGVLGGSAGLLWGTGNPGSYSEQMRLTTTGLGIGTSSPGYKLDVNTTGGSAATARLNGNDQANVRLRLENGGSGGRTWELVGGLPGANNANFSIRDVTGSTTPLTIDSSGNLGIGTSSPAYPLQVRRPGGACSLGLTMDNYGSIAELARSVFYYAIGDSTSDRTGHLFFTRDATATDNLRVAINSAGNVGIGTASPGCRLQVTQAASAALGAQIALHNNASSAVGNAVEIALLTDGGASPSGTRNARIRAVNENVGNGAANMQFWTWNGSTDAERMRLNSTGLGISEGNNPTQALSLYRGGSTNAIMSAGNSNTGLDGTWFGVDTAGNGIVNVRGAFPLIFSTSALERARITSGGDLLVGGTTVLQSAILSAYGSIAARNSGVDGTYANAFVGVYSGNANEHNAIQTSVSSTGTASGFRFKASDGGGLSTTTTVLDLTRTQTIFYTGGSERARITSGGKLLVGTTTAGYGLFTAQRVTINPDSDGIVVAPLAQNLSAYTVQANNDTGTRYALYIANGSSTAVGTISFTSAATAYNTTSDRRLKDNIAPADDAGEVIDAIEVVKHDWKVGGHTRYGMIAQDLHMVAPEAVLVGDADDVEDFKNPWGVDYSKLVPMLVKELQSLRQRVAQLENK